MYVSSVYLGVLWRVGDFFLFYFLVSSPQSNILQPCSVVGSLSHCHIMGYKPLVSVLSRVSMKYFWWVISSFLRFTLGRGQGVWGLQINPQPLGVFQACLDCCDGSLFFFLFFLSFSFFQA